jgi:hypothetical protein
MIVLFHDGGPQPCDGPALGLVREMDSLHELPADNVLKLDGSKPTRGEYVFCGSCGRALHPTFLRRH